MNRRAFFVAVAAIAVPAMPAASPIETIGYWEPVEGPTVWTSVTYLATGGTRIVGHGSCDATAEGVESATFDGRRVWFTPILGT